MTWPSFESGDWDHHILGPSPTIHKEPKYFDLFNRMASHMIEGAQLLERLFEDFDRRAQYAEQIKSVEYVCDQITHDIIRRLNQTFITPFDREDIHALAKGLDDIIDYMEYCTLRTALYQVEQPPEYALQLTDMLERALAKLESALAALGRGDGRIIEECIAIHGLEKEGDALHHAAIKRLFSEERGPIKIIIWKELYEAIEESIDKCDDVGDVLEPSRLRTPSRLSPRAEDD